MRGRFLYVRIWRLQTSDSDVLRQSPHWKGVNSIIIQKLQQGFFIRAVFFLFLANLPQPLKNKIQPGPDYQIMKANQAPDCVDQTSDDRALSDDLGFPSILIIDASLSGLFTTTLYKDGLFIRQFGAYYVWLSLMPLIGVSIIIPKIHIRSADKIRWSQIVIRLMCTWIAGNLSRQFTQILAM